MNRGGVISSLEQQNKAGKVEYSSSSGMLSQSFHGSQVSGNMLPMAHNSGMTLEPSSTNAETFQDMLASQDVNSSLQVNRGVLGGSRYSDSESGHIGPSVKSLSHPNLRSISPRAAPRGTSMSQAVPSQAPPIPFPASLGGFMVGHFTSPHHPHLQPQPLSMNPAAAGGMMHGLGLTVGSNPAQQPSSIAIAQTLSLSNPSQPMPAGLLTGAGSNPSISIMNTLPQVSSLSMPPGGSSKPPNLPPSTSLPMPRPLTHNLQNPNLPLIQGMPNMYSYPYAATLPTQPATSSPAGFPPQSFVPPGYSQYLPPSLYSNSPQQPR